MEKQRKRQDVHDPEIRAARRAQVPETRRLVEDVAPRMLEDAFARRIEHVPEAWKRMVAEMRAEVHAEAENPDEDGLTIEERHGYHWSFMVGRVGDMLDYLMREIRTDIGFENGTLASMLLVQDALLRLDVELQDGGTKGGRGDGEENLCRVLRALQALLPRFDDVSMRRFRAVQVAEFATDWVKVPSTNEEIQADVENQAGRDPQHHHEWVKVDQPVVSGVYTQSLLAEIDPRFGEIDPLVVFEEFSEAVTTPGGKADGGEGKVGPVRAVARLAVMCSALEYQQEPGEDFDAAVSRARGNLLVTRSRIRKELRSFPGRTPGNALGDG